MTDLRELMDQSTRTLPPLHALPDGAAARVARRRIRRSRAYGTGGALGVVAVTALVVGLLPGGDSTLSPAAASPDPGVQLCLPAPVARPTALQLRCETGSPALQGITWQTYTPSTATGTGSYVDAGVTTPVSVRLSGQAVQAGAPVYTFLELEVDGQPPADFVNEEPLLGVRPGDASGGVTTGELPGVRGTDPTQVSVRPSNVCVACFPDQPADDVVVSRVHWDVYTSTHAVGTGHLECRGGIPCSRDNDQVRLVLTAPVVRGGQLQFATVQMVPLCRTASALACNDEHLPDEITTALVLGPDS